MKYVRNINNPSWVGIIPDEATVPLTYIEISEEEYIQVRCDREPIIIMSPTSRA